MQQQAVAQHTQLSLNAPSLAAGSMSSASAAGNYAHPPPAGGRVLQPFHTGGSSAFYATGMTGAASGMAATAGFD